jgi:murein DD-endopeptidase MepM/ murein hydrolase activator NlpD
MVATQQIEVYIDWRRYINPWRALPLAIMLIPVLNQRADLLLSGLTSPTSEVQYQALTQEPAEISVSAHKIEPINKGDTIAGYTVTSGYGPRPSPCPGCSSEHPAIDVATPTGTPLHAVGDIEVTCKSGGGSGNYAEFEYQGILHQSLHLDTCTPGSYSYGEKFATTGATGNGTGPHLDVRVKQDDQRVMPSKQVIWAMLDPSAFTVQPEESSPENVNALLDVGFDIQNGDPTDEVTATFHAMLNLGYTDPYQISYVLATAQHESASFSTLKEIGRGEGCGAGNAYDGFTGIGLVQLTWEGNYQRAAQKLGFGDMSAQQFCKELAARPDIAVTILVRGMMEGWFTGLALPQYVGNGKKDYINARRTVNGTDRAQHIANIAKGYEPKVKQWLADYGY